MDFSILGPLEVRADGRPVALGGPKPRGLLALLLLHEGRAVSTDGIAIALWGDDAPPDAAKTVQVHVSRLRHALGGPDVVVTTNGGYAIRVGAGEFDVDRFERLVADGRRALEMDDAERAASLLRDALVLWRGPPLGDLASLPFAPAEVARLEERRLEALELRIDADLASGRHSELISELTALVQEQPWRERLHAQLMLALYRSGRQADALEAYRRARAVLVGEVGIEPGPELAALQRAILAHDPGLAGRVVHAGGLAGALPTPPNRTIGRASEVEAIAARLPLVRLLTLTGPGGVGKTRLAIEAARAAASAFADGACFVAFAPLVSAAEVPMAIVRALGIVVREETAEDAIVRSLASRNLLLAIDNCEHVLDMAPFVGRLLEACPRTTVLATSREPLALRAEERYPVAPLPVEDAEVLFAERARAHLPDVALDGAVADICRRLDGLPLAIELAAARCALLSPAEIARRLDATHAMLAVGPRDAPARHQTLVATIDWSHELLSEEEKACFARFAVFTGGATLEAAETITGASLDVLDGLVAKSLLVRRPGHRTRLGMLETIRAYALRRFAERPDADELRARHARYYRSLAELHGSEAALKGLDRREHLRALDADIDNLHATLARALDAGRAEEALAMCFALGPYWLMRDYFARAADSIATAAKLPGADAHPRLRALVLCDRHRALGPIGRREEQAAGLADAETTARRLGDPDTLARVLVTRSAYELLLDDLDAATATADEAIGFARAAGDDWGLARAVDTRARAARTPEALRDDVEHAARLLDQVDNLYELAGLLATSAYAAVCIGCDQEAKALVARALPIARDLDNRYMTMLVRGNFGIAAFLTGDIDGADEAFRDELELGRELAVVSFATEGLEGLAAVAAVRDELERAARLSGASGAHRYGQPEYPVEKRLRETVFEPARLRLGAAAWDDAAGDGATIGLDDAVVYALGS